MQVIYVGLWKKHLKIGYTKNMEVRLRGDSSAFKPANEVLILGYYVVEKGKKIEGFIHRFLRAYKSPFGKEWFDVNMRMFHNAANCAGIEFGQEMTWLKKEIPVRVGEKRLFKK
jgi:hypothetical protein